MNKNNVKICQLCAVDFTLYNFLIPLIDGMEREGWEVETVCSYGDYTDTLIKNGYKIKNIKIPRNLNPIKIITSTYLLYKLFKREKYNVVHVHTPIASIIGRVASKLAGIPIVIYTAHGFYFHENMNIVKFKIFFLLEKIAGNFTDILFTQSAEDKNFAIKFNILPEDKIFAIGNGVNKKKFNPLNIKDTSSIKKELKIPKKSYVIGCIARMVEEKGLKEFLDAAKLICKKFENIYFIIIGERLTSDHNSNVETYITSAKKQINKNISFLGLRKDIPEMISIMDLYCLPSWREGMPRSIIEAMMMSKPVIATDIRGSREEVINNQTGLIVPVKSTFELVNAMSKLIKDRKTGVKFGMEGRKRALKIFDEEKVINLQIKLIKKEIEISKF